MSDKWAVNGVSRDQESTPSGADAAPDMTPRKTPARAARSGPAFHSVLSILVGVVGLAALGATVWVYAETQREIKRVSTDIAQIRVSLELYGRQQAAGGNTASSTTINDDRLLDLSNRLALLEANLRNPAAAGAAGPAVTAPTGTVGAVASGGDCLPTGTRFMVSAGDSYPVCGTPGTVSISSVDDGYITLADGTVIAQGGTIALAGTKCMLGVLPSQGDGLSGFAEIRVAC
ncbi:MAG: hypothetical protein ACOH2L_15395 [Devosia sp.]